MNRPQRGPFGTRRHDAKKDWVRDTDHTEMVGLTQRRRRAIVFNRKARKGIRKVRKEEEFFNHGVRGVIHRESQRRILSLSPCALCYRTTLAFVSSVVR